jgi:signal transduction histidine kinase
VAAGSVQASSGADEVVRLVPLFALAVAVVAVVVDPASVVGVGIAVLPVVAFGVWAYGPQVPLAAVSAVVAIPVVVAQRSGQLEPLMFELSLLGFVVGRWAKTLIAAVALGAFAAVSPVVVSVIQDPSEINVGVWILGVVFPWAIGRALARQAQLAAQLEATRRELAQQALLSERRRIARDVHDFVGHGLAAVMLQITSARHVLRRDPAAAEEALRSAEEVGRRSMQELRRTVSLLRSDEDTALAPPPSATEISTLVEQARIAGLAVELQTRGDLSAIPPSTGVALYRIAQEALANAARHAPHARTVLGLELVNGRVRFVAETTGPAVATPPTEVRGRGYGLIGMRERASALGGELAAGPTPSGWRVSCELPFAAGDELPAGGGRSR